MIARISRHLIDKLSKFKQISHLIYIFMGNLSLCQPRNATDPWAKSYDASFNGATWNQRGRDADPMVKVGWINGRRVYMSRRQMQSWDSNDEDVEVQYSRVR